MVLADSFYYQPVQIDTINTRVNADLFAKEGDANSRGMVVQLTENGMIKDTTGITLRLQWSHISVGTSGFTEFEVVDASKGLYKLVYPTSMLHRGRVEAFIRITDNGILSGTRNLLITVERMVGSDETIEASDDFSALQTALTRLSAWEATISGKVDTWEADMEATKQLYIDTLSAAEAAYPQELVSLGSQLADKATKQELEVEKERINTFTTLTTGSTTGDAELIDTRIGADGKTYPNAGGAVRGQISDIKNSLNKSQVALDLGIVWETGYISAGGTRYDNDSSWLKTNTLTIPQDYTLDFTANGFGLNLVAMIAKVNGDGTYTPLVKSRSGNVKTYTFTFEADTNVILSRYKDGDYSVSCFQPIVDKINNDTNKITRLEMSQMHGEITTSWEVGYVSAGGTKYDADTAWLKTPTISIGAGKTIEFTANGYGANLCSMIAKVNGDGTYTPLVKSRSGNIETYTYTFVTNTDVILSCLAVSTEKTVRVKSEWANKIESLELETGMSFSMFEKWGVIGDSFASGVFYDSAKSALDNHLQKSWGQILARNSGNTCINFSMGGLTTGTWLTQEQRGLPSLLSSPPQELYVIALGINDVGHLSTDQPLGTIADIKADFSQNPYTFYGNYGKIIGNIKAHAQKAKIIISTIPYTGESAMVINNAIIAIAAYYGLPCLNVHTDSFFSSAYYWNNFELDHPKSFIYSATANAYERLICDDIKTNTTYWGNVFN